MKRTALALALALTASHSMALIHVLYHTDGNGYDGTYSGSYQSVIIYGSYERSLGFTNMSNLNTGTGTITYRSDDGSRFTFNFKALNLSTDVRCNPVAQMNADVMSTTHASDNLDKFMSANILFRLIYAQMGGNVMSSALAIMPKATGIILSNGKSPVLWKTTWIDGSTTTFLVNPWLPPDFTDQQPPNSETPPTGDTTCPIKAVG
jgi:hypothetical protein